jgi:hypothetical protein
MGAIAPSQSLIEEQEELLAAAARTLGELTEQFERLREEEVALRSGDPALMAARVAGLRARQVRNAKSMADAARVYTELIETEAKLIGRNDWVNPAAPAAAAVAKASREDQYRARKSTRGLHGKVYNIVTGYEAVVAGERLNVKRTQRELLYGRRNFDGK